MTTTLSTNGHVTETIETLPVAIVPPAPEETAPKETAPKAKKTPSRPRHRVDAPPAPKTDLEDAIAAADKAIAENAVPSTPPAPEAEATWKVERNRHVQTALTLAIAAYTAAKLSDLEIAIELDLAWTIAKVYAKTAADKKKQRAALYRSFSDQYTEQTFEDIDVDRIRAVSRYYFALDDATRAKVYHKAPKGRDMIVELSTNTMAALAAWVDDDASECTIREGCEHRINAITVKAIDGGLTTEKVKDLMTEAEAEIQAEALADLTGAAAEAKKEEFAAMNDKRRRAIIEAAFKALTKALDKIKLSRRDLLKELYNADLLVKDPNVVNFNAVDVDDAPAIAKLLTERPALARAVLNNLGDVPADPTPHKTVVGPIAPHLPTYEELLSLHGLKKTG